MHDLFRRLEADWRQNHADLPATDVLGDSSGMYGALSLGDLVSLAHRRGEPAASDAVLQLLAQAAATSDIAARTLLHAVTPGLKAIVANHHWLAPHEELVSAVVASAWERIRRYPVDRRPEHVAANIVRDTAAAVRRVLRTPVAVAPPPPCGSSSEELLNLICDAVMSARLSAESASLILRYRLQDNSLATLAAGLGIKPNSASRRRIRVERRLADSERRPHDARCRPSWPVRSEVAPTS